MSLVGSFGVVDAFDQKVMSKEAAEYTKTAEKRYRKTGDLGASDPGLSVYSPSTYAGSIS